MRIRYTAAMLMFAAVLAQAEPQRDGPVRPVISRVRQPVGTPHKASSFAPHARSGQRTFGAPVSRPILAHVTPKRPTIPK